MKIYIASRLGTGHIYGLGGGGGKGVRGGGVLGSKRGNLTAPPHLNVTSLKGPLLITFDDFHDASHVFIFQANLSGPHLNPSKVFSDPPFWVLLKSSDPPQEILPPRR